MKHLILTIFLFFAVAGCFAQFPTGTTTAVPTPTNPIAPPAVYPTEPPNGVYMPPATCRYYASTTGRPNGNGTQARPWTIRVGKIKMRTLPAGQCVHFFGYDIPEPPPPPRLRSRRTIRLIVLAGQTSITLNLAGFGFAVGQPYVIRGGIRAVFGTYDPNNAIITIAVNPL